MHKELWFLVPVFLLGFWCGGSAMQGWLEQEQSECPQEVTE